MSANTCLKINDIEIHSSQNHGARTFRELFSESDITLINVEYVDGTIGEEEIYQSNLIDCLHKVELLGYSENGCRKEYNILLERYLSSYPDLESISYDNFVKAMINVDWENLQLIELNFKDPHSLIYRIARSSKKFNSTYPIAHFTRFSGDEFFEMIDPLMIIRTVLQSSLNNNLKLTWEFTEILRSGYLNFENIHTPIYPQTMIVTEGSTDTNIIKKAFQLIRPDIMDFFKYIDMNDNYPFNGTGNLLNFVKGLKALEFPLPVLIILDNDTEGLRTLKKLESFKLPINFKIIKLPNLQEFKNFETIGPKGLEKSDINEKAASIEVYLDLKFEMDGTPQIRWTNYVAETDSYQGSLIRKDDYMRKFLNKGENDKYNLTKLSTVIDAIYIEVTREGRGVYEKKFTIY